MEPDLFLCYRRSTDAAIAGRIHDRLTLLDDVPWSIFYDSGSLEPGTPFPTQLRVALASSRVLLVVIGPRWLTAATDSGRRRIDVEDDWVRVEIASALAGPQRVVPVLIDHAEMPAPAELPTDLRPLAELQATRVQAASFHADMDGLVVALRHALGEYTPADMLRGDRGPASQAFLWEWSDDMAERARAVVARLGLLEQAARPPHVRNAIADVARSVLRIQLRLSAVRDLTQLELGRLDVRPAAVDAAEVVRHAAYAVGGAEHPAITLTSPDTLPAMLDRALLFHLVYHLLVFAVENSRLGATRVEVVGRGDRVCLTIRDSGLWIPAAQVDRLQAFRPLGPDGGRRYTGSLPGIAVAMGLAEAMGGQRDLESKDGCTVVEVDLPHQCEPRRRSPREDDETVVEPPPEPETP